MQTISNTIIALLFIVIILMFPTWERFHKLDGVLREVSRMEYGENKCLDFSNKLVEELNKIGIQSEVVIGESPETLLLNDVRHAWVGIWIEPQTGNLTKDYDR